MRVLFKNLNLHQYKEASVSTAPLAASSPYSDRAFWGYWHFSLKLAHICGSLNCVMRLYCLLLHFLICFLCNKIKSWCGLSVFFVCFFPLILKAALQYSDLWSSVTVVTQYLITNLTRGLFYTEFAASFSGSDSVHSLVHSFTTLYIKDTQWIILYSHC